MVTEGLMSLMDIVTRNVLHYVNPEVFLVSGYAYVFSLDMVEMLVTGIQTIISASMFPSALGLIFPVFMYLIALERHQKLKTIMQMHGLKEIYYWLVTILNNYLLYLVVYFCFYFVGRFILQLSTFSNTSAMLMVKYSHKASFEYGLGLKSDRYGHNSSSLREITQNSLHLRLHTFHDSSVHVRIRLHADVHRTFCLASIPVLAAILLFRQGILLHREELSRDQLLSKHIRGRRRSQNCTDMLYPHRRDIYHSRHLAK